mgnify:CR=1 FL=1
MNKEDFETFFGPFMKKGKTPYILNKFYFVDEQGKKHELDVQCTRAIESLGKHDRYYKGLDVEEEIRIICDTEILAELEQKRLLKKKTTWFEFWVLPRTTNDWWKWWV